MLLNYFRTLPNGKLVLWCYLLWYCVIVVFYFDPSLRIWLNSIGISLVIGVALQLSVQRAAADPWQTRRLFIMPFCVSSFSSLIKNQGFWLILPPKLAQLACALSVCAGFIVWVKYMQKSAPGI
jgi:hypothetical protein